MVLIFTLKFFSDTLRGVITRTNIYWDLESIEHVFENQYAGCYLDGFASTTYDQLTKSQVCPETPHLLITHKDLLNLMKIFPIKKQKILILFDLFIHDLLYVKIINTSSEFIKLKASGSLIKKAIHFERFIKIAQFKIKELEHGTSSAIDLESEEDVESEDFEFEDNIVINTPSRNLKSPYNLRKKITKTRPFEENFSSPEKKMKPK